MPLTTSKTTSKEKVVSRTRATAKPAADGSKDSLDGIFRPRSVAVIGASATKQSIGRQTLHNLITSEFQGKVFPVNPTADVIHSIKAYPSIGAIPDEVDLGVIVVPRELVPKVARECGEKGVKGLVVISAGFKEAGEYGAKLETETLRIARKYGMRMVGPNCFGVVNTEPNVRLNATFGKTYPGRGKIAFVSQSGALGEAIMVHAQELNIGFSMIASVGNKADISGNDLLEYWGQDDETEIILMYIENFGNPRKFIRIARELSRRKPIVVVKSGRTAAGARAASSHTGALAAQDVTVDAFFEQTGVIRVDTVEQLFDVAAALANQPIPKGRRVAVATNAGGPAILAVDALVSHGLKAPRLSDSTCKKLRATLPPDTNVANPLDLIAGAGPKEFEQALKILKNDRSLDSLISIFVPPITVNPVDVSQAIINGVKGSKKTVMACFMGVRSGSEGVALLKDHNIPVYKFPEDIGKTLERLAWYREWLDKPKGFTPHYEVDRATVQRIIKRSRRAGISEIVGSDALQILSAYGIAVSQYRSARSEAEAGKVADALGYPVVMKIRTPQILHKTEVGGVAVDLRSKGEVVAAFDKMQKKVEKAGLKGEFSVDLQKMLKGGVETVMGMTLDPMYGPLIMFGLGGVFVEVMKDVSFRVCPVSDVTAGDMISAIKSYPLLAGFRGAKKVDQATLQENIMRLSQLVNDFHDFAEIDINPFIATHKKGASAAVDARLLLKSDG